MYDEVKLAMFTSVLCLTVKYVNNFSHRIIFTYHSSVLNEMYVSFMLLQLSKR